VGNRTASVLRGLGAALVLVAAANADAAAGRTRGSFAVSPTGAATYTIPIWVPHGPRGIQPNLALVYNSQSGDGILGPGWNLAGLSAISRCNKTYAQDSALGGVSLSYSDRFCLDGQRLRLTSSENLSTYGQAGTTYQTEIANFANVTAYGATGNGPTYFIVQGKDGLIYEYGNTTDSRILYGTTVDQWLLNKVRDRNGNNYAVTYGTGAAGSVDIGVPVSIAYTPASAGSSTYNYTVAFSYGTRLAQNPSTTDPAIVGYVDGVQVVNTGLLLGVTVSSSSTGTTNIVRKYTMGYGAAPVTTRARLMSVTECGGSAGTDCLPPTNMTYQDGTLGVSSTSNTAVAHAPNNFVYGRFDFNGDGYNDVIYYNGTTWSVAFGSATGYGTPVNTGVAGNPLFGDLSNAGKDGILAVNGSTWYYYTWNGTSFVGTSTGLAADTATTLADIDGDGRLDLIYFSTVYGTNGSISIHSRLNTSTGGTVSFSSTLNDAYEWTGDLLSATLLNPYEPYLGGLRSWDFDGDGRQDLALLYKTTSGPVKFLPAVPASPPAAGSPLPPGTPLPPVAGTWYYAELLAQGTTFFEDPVVTSTATAPPPVKFVNWNNDGNTDFIVGSTINIASGNGGLGSTFTVPGTILATLDWNGDGRTDVLVINGSTIGVYLSTATGLGSLISTSIPYTSTCNYYTFDANGDGLDDLMCWDQLGSTAVKYYLHNGAGTPSDLLASVTDGYSVSTSPTYVSLVQNNYSKYSDATYPEEDWIGPQYVVNQFSATDGTGGNYVDQFWYFGERVNLQGRGSEGYYAKRTWDNRTGFYDYTYYLRAFPFTGWFLQDGLYQSDGATLISHVWDSDTYTTLDGTANNQRYFPYASQHNDYRYEFAGTKNGQNITQTVTNNTFDNYGNATTVATTTTDTDTGSPYYNSAWGTTTVRTITPDTSSNWCLGLPSQIQVTRSAPSTSNLTRTVGYTPDYVNCRETAQIVEPSSSTYKVTESFGFDGFGNINSDAVTGLNMTGRTTTANWGTTGQFPVTVTNALSQPTTLGYNYDQGFTTSEKDPNGIQISWTPDNFSRVALESRPDGTSTATTYNTCASVSGGCQNGDPGSSVTGVNQLVVIATQKDTGGNVVRDDYTYQDQFDRTIVTKARTLSGGYNRIGTQYDSLGRIYRVTAPCDASSCSVYWTTNSYDTLNRITQQQRPISASNSTLQTTTFTYAGRTSTVTDPQSKTTTTITKVTGAVGRSQDHNGYYQNFNHDAFDSLASVTDSLSNTLFTASYAYGLAAFETDVTDTDMDVSTASGQHRHYNYNALGELTTYSDAKGQNFTFSPFDALGRPTTRTEPDLTTTWTWGTSASSYNIGRLASVATTGGLAYSESYSFDSAGRLSGDTKQGQLFGFTYNTQGTLSTLTYPTSTNSCQVVLNYGYSNGLLSSVTDASNSSHCTLTGTVYWTANTQNPRGQITKETLGNGVVTNRGFDAVTGWLASIQAGVGGGTGLQNQSYLYDYVGNVTQRQNNALGLTESFCYDNLYRLDHSTLTGVCTGTTNLQMAYDATGNITSRSDIASGAAWTYSTTHKHQVLQAGDTSHTYTYDNDGNAITRNGYTIGWSSYNYPTSVASSGEGSTFYYGPNREKWMQVYSGPAGNESTIYYGKLLEAVTTSAGTDYRHYIFAGSEWVAVYSRTSAGVNTVRYALEDNLGSPSVLASSSGALVVNENFAAYGARRNPATWSGPPTSGDLTTIAGITRQGYTGQSMLGNMGLIHMNGRIQDAVTGRFLSPDPTIPNPMFTQSFNRYSYVNNNPLSYIDPSGFDNLVPLAPNTACELGCEVINITCCTPPDRAPDAPLVFPTFESLGFPGSNGPGSDPAGPAGNDLETITIQGKRPKNQPKTPRIEPVPCPTGVGANVAFLLVSKGQIATKAGAAVAAAGGGIVLAGLVTTAVAPPTAPAGAIMVASGTAAVAAGTYAFGIGTLSQVAGGAYLFANGDGVPAANALGAVLQWGLGKLSSLATLIGKTGVGVSDIVISVYDPIASYADWLSRPDQCNAN